MPATVFGRGSRQQHSANGQMYTVMSTAPYCWCLLNPYSGPVATLSVAFESASHATSLRAAGQAVRSLAAESRW